MMLKLQCGVGSSARPTSRRSRALVAAQGHQSSDAASCSRRAAATQLLGGALLAGAVVDGVLAQPATAGEVGKAIVGFWRSRQSQNGGVKLLAPIRVARARLEQAAQELASAGVAQIPEVLALVRSSSLNCYVYEADLDAGTDERASLLTQSLQIADPCTFRLIIKNITDFASPEEKVRGKELVSELIASYSLLDDYLDRAGQGESEAMPKAKAQLAGTAVLVGQVETFVQGVLGV